MTHEDLVQLALEMGKNPDKFKFGFDMTNIQVVELGPGEREIYPMHYDQIFMIQHYAIPNGKMFRVIFNFGDRT